MYIERIEQLEKGRRRLVFEQENVWYYTKARYVLMICPRDRTFQRHFIRNCSLMFLEKGRQSGRCIC